MKLATNMGRTDRIVRITIAIVLAALNLLGVVSGTLGLVLWILAAVFVLTSVVSFCPLYLPFKISTKGK
jgi:K+-transporting ATPase A subunit